MKVSGSSPVGIAYTVGHLSQRQSVIEEAGMWISSPEVSTCVNASEVRVSPSTHK